MMSSPGGLSVRVEKPTRHGENNAKSGLVYKAPSRRGNFFVSTAVCTNCSRMFLVCSRLSSSSTVEVLLFYAVYANNLRCADSRVVTTSAAAVEVQPRLGTHSSCLNIERLFAFRLRRLNPDRIRDGVKKCEHSRAVGEGAGVNAKTVRPWVTDFCKDDEFVVRDRQYFKQQPFSYIDDEEDGQGGDSPGEGAQGGTGGNRVGKRRRCCALRVFSELKAFKEELNELEKIFKKAGHCAFSWRNITQSSTPSSGTEGTSSTSGACTASTLFRTCSRFCQAP